MNDALVIALLFAGIGVAVSGVALLVTIRRLIASVECLCAHVDALSQQRALGH